MNDKYITAGYLRKLGIKKIPRNIANYMLIEKELVVIENIAPDPKIPGITAGKMNVKILGKFKRPEEIN